MALRWVLAIVLFVLSVYGVWEVRRWGTPLGRETISPKQRVYRVWGLLSLLLCLGLMLGATYFHLPHTHSVRAALPYMAYLTLTVISWVPLIPLALLDSRENLRLTLEARQKIGAERRALASFAREVLREEEPDPAHRNGTGKDT